MCFTVAIHIARTEIELHYGRNFSVEEVFEPRYYFSAFDHPKLPVITSKNNHQIELMHWGLIPSWVNDFEKAKTISKNTLNARFETLHEKASFKHLLNSQRCIIIISGFFEWQHLGKQKIPYFIQSKDKKPLTIAGLFDMNRLKTYCGFSLITTEAKGIMEIIHNTKKRMPLMLDKNTENIWLDNSLSWNDVRNKIREVNTDIIEGWRVKTINPSLTYSEEIIKPYENCSFQPKLF